MSDVVILSAARTPIGSFMGSLATLPAPRLGAMAIRGALRQAGVEVEADPNPIEQVLMGNVLSAGVGQAPARQAAVYSGLPKSVGAVTVSKVCGSGMRAVMDAANAITAGEWSLVVAGGMESMSNAPHLLERSRAGYRLGNVTVTDSMVKDGLWDAYGHKHMGTCAELCAKKYNFTREAQDAYALRSYERARAAIEAGEFATEIVAVDVPQGKGDEEGRDLIVVDRDEEPFAAPLSKMSKLEAVFADDGTITAANASTINDGAAALVLGRRSDLSPSSAPASAKPLARIIGYDSVAQEPEWFTTATVGAIQRGLAKASLSVQDIGRWEINEAFAVVSMAAIAELGLDADRVNVRGGAVALGHPIGCSGARILTTLLHVLVDQQQRYGCAAICIGGGEAAAIVVENLRL